MADKLRVLIARDDPALVETVRSLADRIEVIDGGAFRADPTLLQTVEIAYGWFRAEQIEAAPDLRWVQMTGAGANGLLTPKIAESNLVLTNVSGVHAEPIAEHMFGMLLMYTRQLGQAWDAQKAHRWTGDVEFVTDAGYGGVIAGRTLGVLGVGAIGSHCARIGRAFGMPVVGLRRSGEPHPDIQRMYTPADRHAFLSESDVIMNTLPLTQKTRGFLGSSEFASIKRGCIVINAGRGATIDTEALISAVRTGQVGAALLDVTDPEPLPPDHPLWSMPNVYITAHYSGSHEQYFAKANAIFLENMRRYLAGEPLLKVVNKWEGY